MRRAVLGALTVLYAVGCKTHVDSLPSTEDFARDPVAALRDYPQLEKIHADAGRWLWCSVFECPPAEEIIAKWGEPDDWRLRA
jgi:hypothetical protein